MPRGLGAHSNLSWFYGLAISDQVAVLGDPLRPLPRDLARHISSNLGEDLNVKRRVLMREESKFGPPSWKLAEPAAQQLCEALKKRAKWWDSDSLSDHERSYLITHRADDEPPAHAVMVEPPLIRAYLEMKSRIKHGAPLQPLSDQRADD